MDPITVDAISLNTFQQCRRRHLLFHDWRLTRWRPKSLFDHCLREGILLLSHGKDPAEVADGTRTEFYRQAADPGLDVEGRAPYELARQYAVMLDTILLSVAKLVLLVPHRVPTVRLNGAVDWRVLAYADDSGALHRWITVDRLDKARLVSEVHSWYTFGDIAVTRMPMTVHVIEIGQCRDGKYHSSWARGWKHPSMASLPMRFKTKDGGAFKGWKPVWLAEQAYPDTKAWAEQLWEEGAALPLIHHLPIAVPDEQVCAGTVGQILQEGLRMRDAVTDRTAIPWSSLPMSRGACDGRSGPCVFQNACYAAKVVPLDTLALYTKRTSDRVLV